MLKLILALAGLALCISFRSVESGPAPVPAPIPAPKPGSLVAYPWTQWLTLKTPFIPPPVLAAAPVPAPADPSADASDSTLSEDDLLNYLKRAILPVPKDKKKTTPAPADDAETTTKKPKLDLGDVTDFWAPPTLAPNVTSPLVIDPAFWAAKKTMFISRLFAALAKQVLNSTGTVTTEAPTTQSPNAALLKEIDTVLLSDVARSVVASDEADAAPASPKDFFSKFKKAPKKKTKAKGKTTTPTPAAASDEVETTPHPTLDYSSLAKALLS